MFRLSNSFVGANNMAQSSATATASRPRPNAYSEPSHSTSASSITNPAAGVTVSLSCNKTSDRRTIEIPAGKSIQIGRSSKSGFKGLYASSTNALFDCAVVSRDHAELSMTSPWESRPRVTITDKGSLHGTTVNGRKIENGAPYELHTGDVIELGEKITRGDGKCDPDAVGPAHDKLRPANTYFSDAHEGVSLTFKRLDPEQSYHPRSTSPAMNRGYQVPDSPDQEASEYDSDIDLESLYDYNNQQSSAKTTPEQPKHKSGSQESPINLEGAAGPSIIDLSQDDELMVMSPAGRMNNESIVIQETYDEDTELLVPESVPAEAVADPASIDADAFNDQDITVSDDDNDDVESVRMHNTGLCQILMGRDDATSDVEEEEHDDDQEAEESEEEDIEYDGYDSIGDADGQSDSAAPDINDYGSEPESEPESDLDEPSEVYSSAHLQQDSPEPQGPEQLQQTFKTSTIHSVLEQPQPKAQYDPVRGSQPAATASASASLASASMPPASAYVYGFPGYGPPCEMPATDFSDSSRWDIQPPAMPYDGSLGMNNYFTPYATQAHFGVPVFNAPQQSPDFAVPVNLDQYRSQAHTSPFPQAQTSGFAGNNPTSNAPQPLTEASPSKTAGKIAITDIVDDAPKSAPEVVNEAAAMMEEAKKMVAAANEDANNIDSPSNTKRKANEMETATVTESPQQPSKKSKQDVTDNGLIARTPARRTKSRSTVRRVATTAAQYATAAAFGGAATIAFLSSPYAQSLIDFLG